MATVAILANPANDAAAKLAADAASWLEHEGHHPRMLLLERPELAVENDTKRPLTEVDLSGSDLAVSVGGDGTFLRLIPLAHACDVPILGVNFGHLGYLLRIQPPDVETALGRALSGDAPIEERAVLSVSSEGPHQPLHEQEGEPSTGVTGERSTRSWVALNEVVVERIAAGHTVRLGTEIDGEPFLSYLADGVLIATPTGSTAYNLSAGGPVLAPHLRSLVVTPIAPHLGFDRSVVLDTNQSVTIRVEGVRPAVIVIDGRTVSRVPPTAAVTCRTHARPVRFVTLAPLGFVTLLRKTLRSGRDR